MSNLAFLFLPLAFSSLPAVLSLVFPSSQVRGLFVSRANTNYILLVVVPVCVCSFKHLQRLSRVVLNNWFSILLNVHDQLA